MSDAIDPNVLLLLKNQTDYFEKLLTMHKNAFDEQLKNTKTAFDSQLKNAVENSRREFEAESKRIDGRQAADAEMVKVANQAAIKQAETLAIQVAENAETLRKGMEESAKTLAAQLQTMIAGVQTTIGGVEGRVKLVETNQYTLAGSSKGSRDMYGWIFGGVMLLITVVGFFWDKF